MIMKRFLVILNPAAFASSWRPLSKTLKCATLPFLSMLLTWGGYAEPAQTNRELLIKWRDGPQSSTAAIGNTSIGSTVVRQYPGLGWQLVRLPAGIDASEGCARYRELTGVLAVEPNGQMVRPSGEASDRSVSKTGLRTAQAVIPNDPHYSSQWYLPKIGAPRAWETTTGSTNVVIVQFERLDYTHPDLAPNMWRNPGETGRDSFGRDKSPWHGPLRGAP